MIDALGPVAIAKMKEEGAIAAGMLPKIDNALAALRAGVGSARIGDERILERGDCGTQIVGGE